MNAAKFFNVLHKSHFVAENLYYVRNEITTFARTGAARHSVAYFLIESLRDHTLFPHRAYSDFPGRNRIPTRGIYFFGRTHFRNYSSRPVRNPTFRKNEFSRIEIER